MAGVSFFGEVVQQSSRAFWNDEDSDDEIDAGTDVKLQLTVCSQENLSNFTLIIAEGRAACEFAKFSLLDGVQTEIAKVHYADDKNKSGTSTLFKLSESAILCVCTNVPVEQSNEFTTLILPWVKTASRIVVLGSASSTDYKCYDSDLLPSSFLRCLSTESWKEPVKAPLIETPNIVSGVSASVLTLCEVQNFPAVLYVCYAESLQIDSKSVEPFFKLFESSPELSTLLKANIHGKKFSYLSTITSSNMYL